MEKNKPEIRFKGFEEEWESHQLNYYLVVSSDKNQSEEYNKYDIYSVSREYGVINQIAYQGKSFAGASLTNYGVVSTGDVVYTKSPLKSQPYGIIKTNEGQAGIVSALYGVFHPSEEVNSTFVQTYFELDSRLNDYLRPLVNKGAKNTLLISDEDSLNGYVVFPKKDEQEKLVALFSTLDKLIRKLELKLEKLRNIKQSLLKQMFTNVNGGGYAAPLIRFKNYNGDWQMIKLGDITERVVRKNSNLESSLPLTVSAQNGLIDQGEFFNSRIASKDVSGYYLIRKGEFAYNKSSSEGYPYGAIKRLDRYEKGVLSTLYIVFALNNSMVDSDYIVAFYDTNYWHEEIVKRAAEGARNHGLLNISAEDFFDTSITLPIDKNEQYEVGHYFILLDKIITDNREKLSKIRTMKQSLLQKMFA